MSSVPYPRKDLRTRRSRTSKSRDSPDLNRVPARHTAITPRSPLHQSGYHRSCARFNKIDRRLLVYRETSLVTATPPPKGPLQLSNSSLDSLTAYELE
ncbi:hypothetical protein NPIL_600731 [Nephila pilipes]|uniref:Uncharacterized protein n=1 Tax=Nephila pilipes TaxID=299642 RepID=A0A8X6NB33_NEPPI|nr:hypothetical protein NPIL_600731 [Nephila pilipes]